MHFLFAILLIFPVFSKPPKDIKDMFKDKTKIDNPFELRDPFKAPIVKNDSKNKRQGYQISGQGSYTNVQEISIQDVSPQEIKIVGVLIGKERRAIASIKGGVVILKEGMKLSRDEAEVKAILPGGIVIVEKIVNVYGQEEYLETVVPISK